MKKKIVVAAVILTVLAGSLYGLYRYWYPLGAEHRCDTILWFALREYADTHDGAFPAGEATPEASISLIHSLDQYGYEYAYVLHRRDVPIELVQQMLRRGELLTPDTCGWNYTEGLRTDSDSRLALFWDKEGLGHNGERLPEGGHVVTFVGAERKRISAAQWDSFMEEQRKLLAEEKKKTRDKKAKSP